MAEEPKPILKPLTMPAPEALGVPTRAKLAMPAPETLGVR